MAADRHQTGDPQSDETGDPQSNVGLARFGRRDDTRGPIGFKLSELLRLVGTV